MTRSVEIPEDLLDRVTFAYVAARVEDWERIPAEVQRSIASDTRAAMRVALAAIPYPAPAAQPYVEDESDAYAWPSGLSPENKNLTAAPAGDGGLREALEQLADKYADEHGTVSYQWLSEMTLQPLLAAHPAAPAVPQPAHLPNRWGETVEISEEDLQAAAEQSDDWGDGLPAPIGSVVPQPVDRKALEQLVTYFRAQREGCEQLRAANEENGADLTAIDYHARAETWRSAADAVLAVLAGEQEQVEK